MFKSDTYFLLSPKRKAHEIERAAAILRRDYHLPLRMAAVAEEVGMSESYLRHQFVLHYGSSCTQWLTDIRIAHAKELLRNTVLPQKEIAMLCGFSTERYFSRVFHRKMGVPPGAFRRATQIRL